MLKQSCCFKNSLKLSTEIHNFIPGGSYTYSKGDDQFPILSPAAISYGKGSHIWDLDDNEFIDCSMGLTSDSIGHGYEPVAQAVADARFQDILSILYNEYKINQGYSPSDILTKSLSLKGVLEPFSTQGNLDMLKRAGFQDINTVQKYLAFEGFLAIK